MVEHQNQTIIGMAWIMLKAKKMPLMFWGEVVFILNHASTNSLKGDDSLRGVVRAATRRSVASPM
jgi:hypothetical protein